MCQVPAVKIISVKIMRKSNKTNYIIKKKFIYFHNF